MDALYDWVLELWGYFGVFIGSVVAATVLGITGFVLFAIPATFFGLWKEGK